jgi:hypothetical protein
VYSPDPDFNPPEDEEVKIWRYMSFPKFMSLLDKSALFFARPDKLGDPFEGSFGRANLDAAVLTGEEEFTDPDTEGLSEAEAMAVRERKRAFIRRFIYEYTQKTAYINCWHMNNHESAAMWNIYSRIGEGIAVQSTYRRLRDSFVYSRPRYRVRIGTVRYIDYEVEGVPEGPVHLPYLHKRKSYEFEQELRAITSQPQPKEPRPSSLPEMVRGLVTSPGAYVNVFLPTLIEAVYVSPKSPDWFTEVVTAAVRGMQRRRKFGRKVPVIRSNLDDSPIY